MFVSHLSTANHVIAPPPTSNQANRDFDEAMPIILRLQVMTNEDSG